jgi:hypothetical protein
VPKLTARSPLIVDVTSDLSRIDRVMTRIIGDRTAWDEFFRDPNGALIKAGLHPPTTPENNSRANEVFYAALSNKPLMNLLTDHFKKLRLSPAKQKKFGNQYLAGLQQGEVRHDLEQDIEGVNHLVSNADTLREVLRLTLQDINERGILQTKHTRRAIDAYVDRITAVAVGGKSLRREPPLESWDRNYGIGRAFGGLFIEVGPLVTAGAVVEVAVWTTVVVAVDSDLQLARARRDEISLGARRGDRKQIEALAMSGKLLGFAGELMMHVANFERPR